MRSYTSCHQSPSSKDVDANCPGIDETVRRTLGLRAKESDAVELSQWAKERAHALVLPGVEQYGELLAEDSAAGRQERQLGFARFTTGESYFFRDPGQFDLLAATILPELISRREGQRVLRLWSAGCAGGEEAYSLAMLVDELAPRLAGWNVLILGTDINPDAVEKARRGAYGDWSFRALDAERKQRYFKSNGKQWLIAPRLRDRVTFRRCDLIRDRFPDAEAGLGDFDLILCRNVFIYLDAPAVGRITAKFAESLADGGYLVTGHSELFGHDVAPLRVRMFAQSAVFRKIAQPTEETSLGKALVEGLREVPLPRVPTVQLPPQIERQVARIEQRAAPVPAPAASADDCDMLMQTAWRHADRGMPDAAEQDCRKAIALTDLDPRPYFLLAQLAQERGDTVQAKILLNKVIYLDPSFIAAYLELGALHARDGDQSRARRMYETARAALAKLSALTVVAPYRESTAADVIAYVDRLLGMPAAAMAASATDLAHT
ncbi:MAG: CheR family methyltransferase [Georgfuchsia sp.]